MLVLMHTASSHFKPRADGTLVYQKSQPKEPIWLFILYEPKNHLAHVRLSKDALSLAELTEEIAHGIHSLGQGVPADMQIARVLAQRYPRLPGILQSQGLTLYHGRGSNPFRRLSNAVHDWLLTLDYRLDDCFEDNATCEELDTHLVRQGRVIELAPSRLQDFPGAYTYRLDEHGKWAAARIDALVESIVTARGRDPEEGRELRRQSPINAKRHSVARRAPVPRLSPLEQLAGKLEDMELNDFGDRVLQLVHLLQSVNADKRQLTDNELWTLGLLQHGPWPSSTERFASDNQFSSPLRDSLAGELGFQSDLVWVLKLAEKHYQAAPVAFAPRSWDERLAWPAHAYVFTAKVPADFKLSKIPRFVTFRRRMEYLAPEGHELVMYPQTGVPYSTGPVQRLVEERWQVRTSQVAYSPPGEMNVFLLLRRREPVQFEPAQSFTHPVSLLQLRSLLPVPTLTSAERADICQAVFEHFGAKGTRPSLSATWTSPQVIELPAWRTMSSTR